MTQDIAVTGSTGQVGRRIVARLADAGAPVRPLVRGSATAGSATAGSPGLAAVSIGAGYADAANLAFGHDQLEDARADVLLGNFDNDGGISAAREKAGEP